MKKIIILILAVLLIGCSHEQIVNTDLYTLVGQYGISDEGIYYKNENKNLVYYYDFETNENIVLCNKSVCNHNDENCVSFSLTTFKNDTRLSSHPIFHNNQLYYLYESYSPGEEAYLCTSQLDGSERKLLTTIQDDRPMVIQNIIFYKNYMMFSAQVMFHNNDKQTTEFSNEYIVSSIDLQNGNLIKNIFSTDQLFYNIIGAYNNHVYFVRYNDNATQDLISFNLEENKLNTVLDNISIEMSKSFVYENHIFYPDFKTKKIMDFNLKDKIKKENISRYSPL